MSLFKQLAGQTVVYGFGHVLGKVLNYLLIAFYLTRKLRDQESIFGIYNEMYFYVAVLLIVLGLRMETTFFRFGRNVEDRDRAFGLGTFSVLISGGLWLVLALVFGDEIAAALSYPGKGMYIQLLSLLLLIDVLIAMPLARFRLEGKPGKFVFYQLSGIVLNIGLVLFFLEICPSLGFSSWYHPDDILLDVFFANVLARGLILLLLSPLFKKARLEWDMAFWLKMLTYAWPLILVGLAGVINQSSYIILQKYLLDGSILENIGTGGIYAAAAKIALLMSIFVTAYNYAAEPFFFNQYERVDAPYIYAQMTRAFAWVGSLVFLVITLFLPQFQHIVDASYRGLMEVVPIILLGFLFLGLYYNVAVWYKVSDHTHFGAVVSLIGVAITFFVNLFLIPHMGVIASAWASLACYATMLIVCWWLGRRRYPIPYQWSRIGFPVVLALGIWYFSSLWITAEADLVSLSVRMGCLSVFVLVGYAFERTKWKEWLRYT